MPIWRSPSLDQEREICLFSWRLLETPDGQRYLCGYNAAGREGKVSSGVVEIDAEHMTARTQTGRLYRLEGGPDTHPDAEYVLHRWCEINAVDRAALIDVSGAIARRTPDADAGERAPTLELPQANADADRTNRSDAPKKALDEAAEAWRRRSKAAIDGSNAYVEQHGLPLARYRLF
jgi:antitoxin CcdA